MDEIEKELNNAQMKLWALTKDLKHMDNVDKRFLGYAMQYFDTAFTMAFRVVAKKKIKDSRELMESER